MKRWPWGNIAIVAVVVIVVGGLMWLMVASADGARDRQLEREREQIQLGQECVAAGGEWVHNGWSGFLCEFRKDEP